MAKEKKTEYGEKYYTETGLAGFNKDNRMDHMGILEYGGIGKKDIVLEIGCGLGILLSKVKAGEKYGLESNEFAVATCKKKGLNVRLHEDVYRLPFDDKKFDVIIMNEVIEHIPKPEKALREIDRVLKTGGELIITTPNKNFLVQNLAETHCSEMSYKELKKLIGSSNFEVTLHKVRGLSYWDFLGRKIIFPVGKYLASKKAFRGSVSNAREKIDGAKVSHFRDKMIGQGSQQLLIARKK